MDRLIHVVVGQKTQVLNKEQGRVVAIGSALHRGALRRATRFLAMRPSTSWRCPMHPYAGSHRPGQRRPDRSIRRRG
jgi:hypothetical protein